MPVRVYTVEIVPVNKLKPHPKQPQINSRVKGPKMEALRKFIEKWGMWYPIYVYKNEKGEYIICDGHRRFAAAIELSYEEVPCFVTTSAEEADEIHAGALESTQPNSALQWMEQWKNGGYVPSSHRNVFIAIQQLMGDEFIERMITQQIRPNIMDTANKVYRVCKTKIVSNIDQKDALRQIMEWLCTIRSKNVMKVIDSGHDSRGYSNLVIQELWQACQEKRPPKV